MILHIDIEYHMSIESKTLKEIKNEWDSEVAGIPVNSEIYRYFNKCPSAKTIVDLACSEFALKLYRKIYENL